MNIAYFAVAEGWLLLDIGWFVLFLIEPKSWDIVQAVQTIQTDVPKISPHWTWFKFGEPTQNNIHNVYNIKL